MKDIEQLELTITLKTGSIYIFVGDTISYKLTYYDKPPKITPKDHVIVYDNNKKIIKIFSGEIETISETRAGIQ